MISLSASVFKGLQRVVRAIPGPPSARDLPPHPAPAMALARVCLLGALGGAAAGGDLRGGMAQGARASRALGGDTGAATEARGVRPRGWAAQQRVVKGGSEERSRSVRGRRGRGSVPAPRPMSEMRRWTRPALASGPDPPVLPPESWAPARPAFCSAPPPPHSVLSALSLFRIHPTGRLLPSCEALAEGPATLSPGLSFVLGMCAVAGVVAICWAVVMCRRRQVRAAEQQHQADLERGVRWWGSTPKPNPSGP